ncbi:hypothetical protein [Achromobacter ruhlandii]|uniref:hypothetical protein n=1 Tax=Achromobacter ruhlandii TaxID=72557 RepID=UPI003015F3F5
MTLRCGFSASTMRQLVQAAGSAGQAWAINAHRETDKVRSAKAFPFRIAATAT